MTSLSSSNNLSKAAILFFIAGSASTVVLCSLVDYVLRPPKKKKSKPYPSFVAAMYPLEKGTGIGEDIKSTPKADGFRMPAEWEHHVGVWLLFPWRHDNWREQAGPAQKAYSHVANAIQQHGNEQVTVGVRPEHWAKARALLDPHVRVVELACDDSWVRDSGATFVVKDEGEEREVRGIDWDFNAYGGIYNPCDTDKLLARKVLEMEMIRRYKCEIILEGGSIHVDGEGTCLTTEECLLNPNRNPGLTKGQIEEVLCEYLNVSKVIWLANGLYADEDTNGHVDNFACFNRPGEVILHWTDDKTDPQYERSWDAYIRLTKETDAKGRALRVHKMPQPGPLYYKEGDLDGLEDTGDAVAREVGTRLAASYINFYIANQAVIVPQFLDSKDEEAVELLQLLFPERKVVGVYTRDVLLGGGNIHCITQQQPTNTFDAY